VAARKQKRMSAQTVEDEDYQLRYERNAGGTSISNISSKVLGALPVWLPSLSDQRAIGAALNKLNESIHAHQRVIETTAELRTALLPLLMSRELLT
jgi:type I restriction enzyme S subunit